ncbi:MAG: hypothetical protein R2685_11410 [Candidatus Nitrosocosmicus sp.]|nr:hypothetical protein [Candidatus Nitrosocosmicus sp.]
MTKRNRTSSSDIDRALYLYFLGLSTRGVSKALLLLHNVRRSHVLFAKKWKWIQKYKPQKISIKRKSISEFIVDETLIKVGPEYIWLWVTIEPENQRILALFLLKISKERNMFVAERFLYDLIKSMENTMYLLMVVVVHGILQPVDS